MHVTNSQLLYGSNISLYILDFSKPNMGNLMNAITAFITLAILLGIDTIILGGSVADCSTISDYDGTRTNAAQNQSDGTWANQCILNNEQSKNKFIFHSAILILIMVIVILVVRRLA